MEIYFLMSFKGAFSFLIILFHSSKLCVVYVYIVFLMVCLLQILKQNINWSKRKNKKYFERGNLLQGHALIPFQRWKLFHWNNLKKKGSKCKMKLTAH